MRRFAAFALTATLAAVAGCDASFDARGPAPDQAFSVFGILDSLDRPVRVRVEDVREVAVKPEDAAVSATLTDDATGAAAMATVRAVPDGAGGTARVADFGAFVLRQGRTYRLALTGADGRTATAVATIPAARVARADAPESDSTGRVRQAVVFIGAGAPADAPSLVYRIVRTPTAVALAGDTLDVPVPAQLRGAAVDGGYRVWVSPREDAPEILNRIQVQTSQSARVRVLRVTVLVAERSAEWAFVAARTGPHLTHARGVFAATGRSSATLVPDAQAVASAGFRR